MLKIRLRRMGSNHAAFFRIVVSDSRTTPRGPFVEALGYYDPRTAPSTVNLDVERADNWIRRGAHASPTVKRLLARARATQA